MLTKQQALALVAKHLGQLDDPAEDDELIVTDELTIEKPWGWVFFYTSKRWRETGDLSFALAGNAPLIVERHSGRIVVTGTAHPTAHYIEHYERHGTPFAE